MHEIVRVLHVVACPVFFILFDDPDWQGVVLRLMTNDQFILFFAVSVL